MSSNSLSALLETTEQTIETCSNKGIGQYFMNTLESKKFFETEQILHIQICSPNVSLISLCVVPDVPRKSMFKVVRMEIGENKELPDEAY